MRINIDISDAVLQLLADRKFRSHPILDYALGLANFNILLGLTERLPQPYCPVSLYDSVGMLLTAGSPTKDRAHLAKICQAATSICITIKVRDANTLSVTIRFSVPEGYKDPLLTVEGCVTKDGFTANYVKYIETAVK